MAEPLQVVRLVGITGGGTDNDGDICFIDIDDAGERTIRFGMSYLDLPKLIGSLEELQAEIAKERRKHGKDAGVREITARQVEDVKIVVDKSQGAIVLEFRFPNGVSTFAAVKPDDIDHLVSRINAAKAQLRGKEAEKPN